MTGPTLFPVPAGDYAITSPWRTPWVDEARIARDGIAIVCPQPKVACVDEMKKYTAYSAKIENVTWRAIISAPTTTVTYEIVIIPPRSPRFVKLSAGMETYPQAAS